MNSEEFWKDPIFKKVMSLDLKVIAERLMRQRFPVEDCDPEGEDCGLCSNCNFSDSIRVTKTEVDYRRYLHLRAMHPDETLLPFNRDIDDFWHLHILDTKKYAEDCQTLFGRFLHHDPSIEKGTPEYETAAVRTRELYLATYEQPRDPFEPSKPSKDPWPPKDHTFDVACG